MQTLRVQYEKLLNFIQFEYKNFVFIDRNFQSVTSASSSSKTEILIGTS